MKSSIKSKHSNFNYNYLLTAQWWTYFHNVVTIIVENILIKKSIHINIYICEAISFSQNWKKNINNLVYNWNEILNDHMKKYWVHIIGRVACTF